LPRILDLFQQELGRDPLALPKHLAHSCPIVDRLPQAVEQEG
jgi:hypothetical protein